MNISKSKNGEKREEYFTFPVINGKIGIGGTYTKHKLVSHERFICVNSTYCLNQL